MSIWLFIAIILLLAGLVLCMMRGLKLFGITALALSVLCVILSCFAMVGTKNVGVPTSFGKTTGETYGAGLNVKAPWVQVTDVDATIKLKEYTPSEPLVVKIADSGNASVALSYRWRINADTADQVFEDYNKSEDDIETAVRKALVSTTIKAAVNEEFASYDPLQDSGEITTDMSAEEMAKVKLSTVPDYQAYNKLIQENVDAKIKDLGNLIEIQSISISYFGLPERTQSRIDAFNEKIQASKNAVVDVATKNAQAEGNRVLAKSLQDPNVLVSQCFDSLAEGEFKAPAGFSCWPGGAGGVVIPSAK